MKFVWTEIAVKELLELRAEGRSIAYIATQLGTTPGIVERQIRRSSNPLSGDLSRDERADIEHCERLAAIVAIFDSPKSVGAAVKLLEEIAQRHREFCVIRDLIMARANGLR